MAIVVAVALTLLATGCDSNPTSSSGDPYEYSATQEFNYSVGDTVLIAADTFVGSVSFEQAARRSVHVTVTRWADDESDLDLLEVDESQEGHRIEVSASNPHELDDVAVEIEITGPPEVTLDLATGVGAIACAGQPGETWEANAGVGSVELAVPSGVNVSVDLTTGVGSVDVDFVVHGEVSDRRVVGTIGSGHDGSIVAHVGVGSISLIRWFAGSNG
jgi:hypothetical protein